MDKKTWKEWCKKNPNPLDLENIRETRYFKYENYYAQVRAMQENGPLDQAHAFIGITFRKWDKDKEDFVHMDGYEKNHAYNAMGLPKVVKQMSAKYAIGEVVIP